MEQRLHTGKLPLSLFPTDLQGNSGLSRTGPIIRRGWSNMFVPKGHKVLHSNETHG